LTEACKKSNIDINKILPVLNLMMDVNDPDSKYLDGLSLERLCDYIVDRHHTYVNENIPFLLQNLKKLCDVHGENHHELFEIKEHFETAAGNLSMHMKKEEQTLFPYIRNLEKNKSEAVENTFESGKFHDLLNEIDNEHLAEGERFLKISKLTQNYSCPPDGCNTYQLTFKSLKEFEQDLHRHIHLENNILFKKAIELENNTKQE
jgi:regulator of cell morphogenesis and NO signaling